MSIYNIAKSEEKQEKEDGFLIEAICIGKKHERDYIWEKDLSGLKGPLLYSYSDNCLQAKDKKG